MTDLEFAFELGRIAERMGIKLFNDIMECFMRHWEVEENKK